MKFGYALIIAIIFSSVAMYGKDSGLAGKITDKNTGKPLTGVVLKMSSPEYNYVGVTDRFGSYFMRTMPGIYTLTISYYVNTDLTVDSVVIKNETMTILSFAIDPNTLPLERKAPMHVKKDAKGLPVKDGDSPRIMEVDDASIAEDTKVSSFAAGTGMSKKPSPGIIAADPISPASEEPLALTKGTSGVGGAQSGKAGVLTSGEINDFRKWDLWKDINETDLKSYREKWLFNPADRYVIQLVTKDNTPAVDYEVKLLDANGGEVWAGRTDNTGKAELWANLFESSNKTGYAVSINVNGTPVYKENIRTFHNGINIIPIDDYCNVPNAVDIVFAVDATGSMGDEIGYLKAELNDIIGKLKNKQKDLKINLGSIFYRDATDAYVIQKSPLNPVIDSTIAFIDRQYADGGGDFPEAVDVALQEAVNGMNWSKNAVARIMFLILDAPPHETPEVKERLKEIIAKAAMMGIRVVPVTCSGIDKSTEYLMRSMALATNGTYVFLTDDSGVGGSHIKPTTDKYDVELLNDLFIRLISQFTNVPSCSEIAPLAGLDTVNNIYNKDETRIDENNPANVEVLDNVKCYPNPTSGNLTIEVSGIVEEIYIVDIAGKILEKPVFSDGRNAIDLGSYPTGVYFVKFMSGGRWGSQKIMLIR